MNILAGIIFLLRLHKATNDVLDVPVDLNSELSQYPEDKLYPTVSDKKSQHLQENNMLSLTSEELSTEHARFEINISVRASNLNIAIERSEGNYSKIKITLDQRDSTESEERFSSDGNKVDVQVAKPDCGDNVVEAVPEEEKPKKKGKRIRKVFKNPKVKKTLYATSKALLHLGSKIAICTLSPVLPCIGIFNIDQIVAEAINNIFEPLNPVIETALPKSPCYYRPESHCHYESKSHSHHEKKNSNSNKKKNACTVE
ncbi:hypothetical protein GINT2_000799 [Glugoides intestinalis]